ncbi:MAG TPA: FAD-binding protein [Vicinamibacterales bacterium]|jgi:FAD/FMN-containing dehydrogenase
MSTITAAEVITELAPSFAGRLLQPTDSQFDDARRVHNGFVDKRPGVIARCLGAADVADALALAKKLGLDVAVRGGGHNVGGRGTIDNGLLIDLSLMKGLHVDPRARTARAEGGTLWKEFNRASQLHGLATTGGVISSTGIAGLTLGGGLGWLMAKYGMALDNLLSVDLVLADGRAVRAAADENPDLFWGVRGGGGNFGVATSFEFGLHPVGPMITGGLIAHPISQAKDVLRVFRDAAARASDDLMLVAGLLTGPDGVTKLAGIVVCHLGPQPQAEADLKPVKQFGTPLMDVIGPMPYSAQNSMLDASYPRGARNYWKSHFMDQLTDAAIDALIDRFASCPTPMGNILLEHFHGAATRVPPTHTAYALRKPGFNMLVLSQWMDAAHDTACISWARDSYKALQPFTGTNRYMNYMDHDDAADATLSAVYGPNLDRLRQVKAKYDPQNVFHHNVNIKPV